MVIIGVDYHPSDQYIAFADAETGESGERRLNHSDGEAERFYRELAARGVIVRVGMEAIGYSRWFERLLAEMGIEVWLGDAAKIQTKRIRKQKTDRQDAQLLLKLLLEENFPRVWVPSPENRDLRQLLWHRHRLVQMRTRIMNQLQALTMNEGQRRKKKLWSEQGRAQLEHFPLAPWASRRRQDLLALLDRMNPTIEELTAAIEQEAKKRPEALRRCVSWPGVPELGCCRQDDGHNDADCKQADAESGHPRDGGVGRLVSVCGSHSGMGHFRHVASRSGAVFSVLDFTPPDGHHPVLKMARDEPQVHRVRDNPASEKRDGHDEPEIGTAWRLAARNARHEKGHNRNHTGHQSVHRQEFGNKCHAKRAAERTTSHVAHEQRLKDSPAKPKSEDVFESNVKWRG
jgi:Transposase